MVKRKSGKAKPKTLLWKIGFWATWWWAATCIYVLVLVARSLTYYVDLPEVGNFFSNWWSAISSSFTSSVFFTISLACILAGWIIGGIIWMCELKKQKISYKAAFKDLFLTIRK